MTSSLHGEAGRRAKARTSLAALALVIVAVACADKVPPFPSRDVRTDSFARLVAGTRLGYAPAVLELLDDAATANFDSSTLHGIDEIAQNWARIQSGAGVSLISRRILVERAVAPRIRRDSGTIVFRLQDKSKAGAFHDTVMTFVTLWVAREGRWKIFSDSIRGAR